MPRILLIEIAGSLLAERNHQGSAKKLIVPMNDDAANIGSVVRQQRLGRVLNYYYRKAA